MGVDKIGLTFVSIQSFGGFWLVEFLAYVGRILINKNLLTLI